MPNGSVASLPEYLNSNVRFTVCQVTQWTEPGWQFPSRNDGIDYVNDPSGAHVGNASMPKLVREWVRNAFDAKRDGLSEPVLVTFTETGIKRGLIGAAALQKYLQFVPGQSQRGCRVEYGMGTCFNLVDFGSRSGKGRGSVVDLIPPPPTSRTLTRPARFPCRLVPQRCLSPLPGRFRIQHWQSKACHFNTSFRPLPPPPAGHPAPWVEVDESRLVATADQWLWSRGRTAHGWPCD